MKANYRTEKFTTIELTERECEVLLELFSGQPVGKTKEHTDVRLKFMDALNPVLEAEPDS